MQAESSPLHLPRRHRRRLLFPPGLLALAGLLWVGCVALEANRERLKRRNVMQLTVMPLKLSAEMREFYGDAPLVTWPARQRQAFRPWCDLHFTGSEAADEREQQRATAAVRAMSTHDPGILRIRFAHTAPYKQLVFVLNLMQQENIKKYMLDTRESPAVFYVFPRRPSAHLRASWRGFGKWTGRWHSPQNDLMASSLAIPSPLTSTPPAADARTWLPDQPSAPLPPVLRLTGWLLVALIVLSGGLLRYR